MARWNKSNRFRVATMTFESMEQRERIDDYADSLGITVSMLMRTAIDHFMGQHPEPRYYVMPLLPEEGDTPKDFGVFDHFPTELTPSGAYDDFVGSFRSRRDAEQEVIKLNEMR